MKTSVHDILPLPVQRTLAKLGQDIANARRKRHLTNAMMAERTGVAPATYRRVERGDPTVSFGAYAMALFVLGFHGGLRELADVRRDEVGLQLDAERLPQRVRVRKTPVSR